MKFFRINFEFDELFTNLSNNVCNPDANDTSFSAPLGQKDVLFLGS